MYWVGLILILVFAVELRWLPPSGFGSRSICAAGTGAGIALDRLSRADDAVGNARELGSDYVRTARAKGLSRARGAGAACIAQRVDSRDHGSRARFRLVSHRQHSHGNGLQLAGLGRYVVNAIARRDLPAIQGTVLFMSVVFVAVNLLTDLTYAATDPRIAYD